MLKLKSLSMFFLFYDESILSSVPKNRLKFIVEIKNEEELTSFLKALLQFRSENNTERLNQIIGLD